MYESTYEPAAPSLSESWTTTTVLLPPTHLRPLVAVLDAWGGGVPQTVRTEETGETETPNRDTQRQTETNRDKQRQTETGRDAHGHMGTIKRPLG